MKRQKKTEAASPGCTPRLLAAAFAGCLLSISASASLAAVSGDSTTIVRAKKVDSGKKIIPVYEYLNVSIAGSPENPVSFHAGGWGKLDLTDQGFDERRNGDLNHAYLLVRSANSNAIAKLGRFAFYDAGSAEKIDGLYGSLDLKAGFAASLFLGKPVESVPDTDSGSVVFGGRISHTLPGIYQLGLSYLKENGDDNRERKDLGIDLSLTPHKLVAVSGKSLYNDLSKGWKDNSYNVAVGPFEKVSYYAQINQVNYRDYFTSLTTNAFKFNSGYLNAGEDMRMLGHSVALDFPEKGSISAEYRNYDYSLSGTAHYYGVTSTYKPKKDMSFGAGIHRMSGDNDRLDYSEVRVYAQKQYGHLDVTADLFDVKYQTPINNISNTYNLGLACGYEVSEKVKLGADMGFYRSPEVRNGVDLLAKVQVMF